MILHFILTSLIFLFLVFILYGEIFYAILIYFILGILTVMLFSKRSPLRQPMLMNNLIGRIFIIILWPILQIQSLREYFILKRERYLVGCAERGDSLDPMIKFASWKEAVNYATEKSASTKKKTIRIFDLFESVKSPILKEYVELIYEVYPNGEIFEISSSIEPRKLI